MMPSCVWSAPPRPILSTVSTCPLISPSGLALARIRILSPGQTSMRREMATSNEPADFKGSVRSWSPDTMTTLPASTRTTAADSPAFQPPIDFVTVITWPGW